MPFLPSSFKGSSVLFTNHLETIVPALLRTVKVHYTRERLILKDGDFLDLDWIRNNSDKLLVLLHGLEGSSGSTYIKGFAKYFTGRGWDICVMNFRSCSGEMNRLLRSYHSGATSDVHEVMEHIQQSGIYKHMVMGGFSLGGNILLKYLGEYAKQLFPSLKTAFAFSVPVDLSSSALEMARSHNRIYMKRFLMSLNRKMILKAKQFPGSIDIKGIHKIKTFYEFDDRFTAPIHGFENAMDYYTKSAAIRFLDGITLPTLLVNASNDPFLGKECYPSGLAGEHPCFYFEMPEKGGHIGFSMNFPRGSYWSEWRAWQFIQQQLFH